LAPLLQALSGAEPDGDTVTDGARELQAEIATDLTAAAEHYRAGDVDGSEARYRKVLAKAPQHPAALHYLGAIAGIRGRHAEAARLMNQSITISPHRPDVHFDLGIALLRLERHGEAESAFRNVLTLQPDHMQALTNFGQILLARGREA